MEKTKTEQSDQKSANLDKVVQNFWGLLGYGYREILNGIWDIENYRLEYRTWTAGCPIGKTTDKFRDSLLSNNFNLEL